MTQTCTRPELHLHPSRAVPLYYSLALAFEAAIIDGRINIGDILEPVAALHERLRLAPGTIRRGLRLLEDRGIVERTSRTTVTVVAFPDSGTPRAPTSKDFS